MHQSNRRGRRTSRWADENPSFGSQQRSDYRRRPETPSRFHRTRADERRRHKSYRRGGSRTFEGIAEREDKPLMAILAGAPASATATEPSAVKDAHSVCQKAERSRSQGVMVVESFR